LKAQEVAERQKQDADASSYLKASALLVDEVQEPGENTKTPELMGDEVQHADDWDGWMEECQLNPNSLLELEGALVERHLALSVSSSSSAPDGVFDTVQFVRQGYFVLDRPVLGCEDSREGGRERARERERERTREGGGERTRDPQLPAPGSDGTGKGGGVGGVMDGGEEMLQEVVFNEVVPLKGVLAV
jgi:hypothetical protein